jgi:hypothetical protein
MRRGIGKGQFGTRGCRVWNRRIDQDGARFGARSSSRHAQFRTGEPFLRIRGQSLFRQRAFKAMEKSEPSSPSWCHVARIRWHECPRDRRGGTGLREAELFASPAPALNRRKNRSGARTLDAKPGSLLSRESRRRREPSYCPLQLGRRHL